jgi:hypothetical protein
MSRTVIPAGVHPEDLLVEAREPGLAFLYELRVEAPVAVSGHLDLHRTVVGLERLRAGPVTRIRCAAGLRIVPLVPEVIGHLGLHRPLDEPGRQLL